MISLLKGGRLFSQKRSSILIVVTFLVALLSDISPWSVGSDDLLKSQYITVESYINIAKAAREKGSLFAIKSGEEFSFYEPGYNEPGYAVLVSFLSILGFNLVNPKDLAAMNYWVYWFSVLVLVFSYFFISQSLSVTSLIFFLNIIGLFIFRFKFFSASLADYHGLPASLINICFSAHLLFLKFYDPKSIRISNFFKIIFFGSILSLVAHFRISVGLSYLIGVVLSSFFIIGKIHSFSDFKSFSFSPKKNLHLLTFLVVIVFSFKFTTIVLEKAYYKQTELKLGKKYIAIKNKHTGAQRGVWDSAFGGLGVIKNSWGIEWSDGVILDFIRKDYPGFEASDPKFFEYSKNLYLKFLTENPYEFISIYFKKTIMSFGQLRKVLIFSILYMVVFYLFYFKLRFSLWREHFLKVVNVPILVVFVGLLIIPVLSHPIAFSVGIYSFAFQYFIFLVILYQLSMAKSPMEESN